MKRTRFSLTCRRWFCTGVLLLCLVAGPGAAAQSTPSHDEYFDICRRLGFLPGRAPMRRCILEQRSIDLDPLSALDAYQLTPPDPAEQGAAEPGPEGNFPGAQSAEELLKSTPDELLLGHDYRARGQGIYE